MLNPLIQYLLTAGGITTLLFFLFRTLINKSFDFGVEKYKVILNEGLESHKQKLLLETEKFKSELNLVSIEHNIAFGELQKERAIVIKNTYLKLLELHSGLFNLTTMFQGPSWHSDLERDKTAEKSLEEFQSYFRLNRIYLTKDVCEKIMLIIIQSKDVIIDMSFAKEDAKSNINIGDRTPIKQWRELNKKVTSEIEIASLELEDNFRKLLGDK
jgi:hypothetical protein